MTNNVIAKLNQAKKQKGYTLKQLAEKSGLSLGTVNKIMSGSVQTIKADKLQKLMRALELSAQQLGQTMHSQTEAGYLGLANVACISADVKVGDVAYNAAQVVHQATDAANNGVHIALFPELCLTGYSCGDLFFQSAILNGARNALVEITRQLAHLPIVCILGLPLIANNGKLYNVAAVLFGGKILGIVPKSFLPNYNEFIEKRLFATFEGQNTTVTIDGCEVPFGSNIIFANSLHPEVRFACEICEDVWVAQSPSFLHCQAGASAIFNLSASNETVVKAAYRRKMIEIQSAKCGAIYAYCSAGMNESTSQTVFSAHNIICENGEIVAESLPFGKGYATAWVDFGFVQNERNRMHRDHCPSGYQTVTYSQAIGGCGRVYSPTPFVPTDKRQLADVCETTLNILAYGLKKRLEHIGASKLVIGVSGGSDSTLALIVCKRALGLAGRPSKDILSVTMPCFGTSKRTLGNSVTLAKVFGTELKQIDITKSVTQHLEDIGHDLATPDVTFENAQARERTQVLMDLANSCNGLVIGTGDMSESALGWATYNGDHMSMYSVNGSVPKTLVKTLIRHVAENSSGTTKKVLLDVLDTPVSPELLPKSAQENKMSQVTEDIVGPYLLHDYFLFMMVRKGFSPSKVFKLAEISFDGQFDSTTIYKWLRKFVWRFFSQQFKRSCAPDCVKLGSVDIGKYGMRMPSDASCQTWLDDLATVEPKQ